MCAVGRTVEPSTLDRGMDDASILPSREVRLGSETAREQVAPIPEFDLRQPIMDRGPGLLHDFELDRSPCLFLDHGATVSHPREVTPGALGLFATRTTTEVAAGEALGTSLGLDPLGSIPVAAVGVCADH